eukprot:366278-Chlamydomonas_euryale.AAC.51
MDVHVGLLQNWVVPQQLLLRIQHTIEHLPEENQLSVLAFPPLSVRAPCADAPINLASAHAALASPFEHPPCDQPRIPSVPKPHSIQQLLSSPIFLYHLFPTHQWHLTPEDVVAQHGRGQPPLLAAHMAKDVQRRPGAIRAARPPFGGDLVA